MKFPRIAAFLRFLADKLDSDTAATSIVVEPTGIVVHVAHLTTMTSTAHPERLLELFPGDVLNLSFDAETPPFHPPVLH